MVIIEISYIIPNCLHILRNPYQKSSLELILFICTFCCVPLTAWYSERNDNFMKRILLMSIIILLFASFAQAASQTQSFAPANVNVFIDNKQIFFDDEPVIVNNNILLPLRKIAESLNVNVKWYPPNKVYITKDGKELILRLEDSHVLYGRKLFVMEQAPILIKGHAMVSLRFIASVLGANITWDETQSTVNIADNGHFAELLPAIGDSGANADKYYKWYDVLIGPNSGPNIEEAKEYILKQGILTEVRDIQYTRTNFYVFSDSVTMVSGIDGSNQEKLIWLSEDVYTGDISISGTALKNIGLSQETVTSILQEKGISKVNIKTIYIAPYNMDTIYWFVKAEQDNKQYYYCLDFYSGAVTVENVQKVK